MCGGGVALARLGVGVHEAAVDGDRKRESHGCGGAGREDGGEIGGTHGGACCSSKAIDDVVEDFFV